MKKEEFNGYNFDEKKDRKKMKYLIVFAGDLVLNTAYAFESKKDLAYFLKNDNYKEVQAIFKIEDITPNLNQ